MLASDELYPEFAKQPTRAAYAEAVIELGQENQKVVVLDADVSKSIGTNRFAEKFPERSFNFGIA
jgi:transketolase